MFLLKALKTPSILFSVLFVMGIGADFGLDGFVKRLVIAILINTILAMSLNLVNGYTGQFSLGHAGFMAVGAYFSAWLSNQIPHSSGFAGLWSFPVLAVMGGLMAGLAGLLVGLPSLRLKGDYLAIVTLGFAEIIRVVLLNTSAVGGATGYNKIPGPDDILFGASTVSKFFLCFLLG